MAPDERVQALALSVGVCAYVYGLIRLCSIEVLFWVFLGHVYALAILLCGLWLYDWLYNSTEVTMVRSGKCCC